VGLPFPLPPPTSCSERTRRKVTALIERLGIFCPPGRGHLHPATALGRYLKTRGYEVTVFHWRASRAAIATSGLSFKPLDSDLESSHPLAFLQNERLVGPNSLDVLDAHASLVLKQGHVAVAEARIQALIVDQADLAAGSVADFLGIPFLNISAFPPVYLDDECPPFIFTWVPRSGHDDRPRNRRGNALMGRMFAPILARVNKQRQMWGLPEIENLNEVMSQRAIITQLPEVLDFPRRGAPPHLFYTGPFYDAAGRPTVGFPWSRCNGKPLVYATMGTVRFSRGIFEMIAAACAHLECQLVISLGGGILTPNETGNFSGDPIIVHYCPQEELLRKASLCITHGGMNTVLDSVKCGVPLIVIPVADDQPGVAARVEWLGLGRYIPLRNLSVSRLQELLKAVFMNSTYLSAVRRMQIKLQNTDGLKEAADIVDRTLSHS
jgi:zeaxanthin glucosyltransferase